MISLHSHSAWARLVVQLALRRRAGERCALGDCRCDVRRRAGA
jgi:hypothetical protein